MATATSTITDHADEATAILQDPAVITTSGDVDPDGEPLNLFLAHVHATLAIAQAINGLADALRETRA